MLEDVEEDEYDDGDGLGYREVEIREQDRFLPVANIARIMKRVIPGNAKIAKDAKESLQECVSEFISFITSEASEKCQQEKRKTINGDDILWAMSTLGFDKYVDPLKEYLYKYRDSVKGEKPDKKSMTSKKDLSAQPKKSMHSYHDSLPSYSVPYSTSYTQPAHTEFQQHHQTGVGGMPYGSFPPGTNMAGNNAPLIAPTKGEAGGQVSLPPPPPMMSLQPPLSLNSVTSTQDTLAPAPYLQTGSMSGFPSHSLTSNSDLSSSVPVTVNVKLEPQTQSSQKSQHS